jgi:hypothetical protein
LFDSRLVPEQSASNRDPRSRWLAPDEPEGRVVMANSIVSRNEGALDRGIRILAGVLLLAIVFVGPRTPLGWIGLVPLVTGLVGWCPLYTVLGLRTCPVEPPSPS